MSQDIFKICYLETNRLYKIEIFSGGETITDTSVFDMEELDEIEKNNTNLHYNESRIFFDDTIDIIKKKILDANEVAEIGEVIYEELYLYCEQEVTLTIEEIFNNLKHKEIGFVSKEVLTNFLHNINTQQSITKDYYDYNELIEFFYELKKEYVDEIEVLIKVPLELELKKIKYNSEKNIYPFMVTPFGDGGQTIGTYRYDSTFETNSYNLLFKKIKKIHKNRIYCCIASNVLNYAISNSFIETEYVKQYYPLLYKASILTLTTLEARKHTLYIDYNEKKKLYLENDKKIHTLNKVYLRK